MLWHVVVLSGFDLIRTKMTPRFPHRKGEETRLPWTTWLALGCIALLAFTFSGKHHTSGHDSTTLRLHYQSTTNCSSQHHGATNPDAAAFRDRYFPQYQQQCGNSKWRHQYAQLHRRITRGQVPPLHLTSVAAQAGMGDRITGLVTQFYLALLSKRALTMVTYGDLPPFESACMAPFFNFSHPQPLPDDALNPVKTIWSGPRTLPDSGPVNSSTYHILYLTNQPAATLDMFKHSNLSAYPPEHPDIPYGLSASNRGHTHHLMHNPYHRKELSSYGLRPETAFMCGWFTLCAPNTAVQALYRPCWDALSEPGVLRIGINVRLGDAVFRQQDQGLGDSQLAVAAPYFECAETLEKAFAVPGQKVLWYLMADAMPLRVAAKAKYGAKLLTDTTTVTQHPDCRSQNPDSCNQTAMDLSIQHAVGQLFTCSLADFHIMPKESGLARLGAWVSGKYDNLFEFDVTEKWGIPPPNLTTTCDPKKPTTYEFSSRTWAQV